MEWPEADFFKLPPTVQRSNVGPCAPPRGRIATHYANLKAIVRIRRRLREDRPRAVLSFVATMNIFVILASLGLGLRVLVSERNDPLRQDIGPLWGLLRKLLYRRAEVVSANSLHAIDVMAGYVPSNKLIMIPNPVTIDVTCAQPGESCTILSVGRLVPQKGQDAIIDAFAGIVRNYPDWHLSIIGDGPLLSEYLEQARRRNLTRCIALPGNVADPGKHYERAAVFVLASAYEGTPNTLLEAMAHALPCVVPDCLPGALEYIDHGVTGLVYHAGDLNDLVSCLALLAGDPELRTRLGRRARERVRHLSVDSVRQQWDNLLFPAPVAQPAAPV
jgi:glycosyltransferase involved in cell wall biosynthesis